MADPRIIEYIRQNMGNYPIETLKAACVKNGFSPAEVEEAALEISGAAPPPPPPGPQQHPGGPAPASGVVLFSPKHLFPNALEMFKRPEAFFSRVDPNGRIGGPITTIILWAMLCAPLSGALLFIKLGATGAMLGAGGSLLVLPIVALAGSLFGATLFHVLCSVLGGVSSFGGSFAAVAAMAALMPLSTILGMAPFGGALTLFVAMYFYVNAAAGLHRISKPKAWTVFGILFSVFIAGSVALSLLGSAAKKGFGPFVAQMDQMHQMQSLGQTPDPPSDSPQNFSETGNAMNPEEALTAASRMMQALGDEETNRNFQSAVSQAQNDPMAVIRDMQKYQKMPYPPKETLLLLDSKTSGILVKEWPALSGPLRKSLVETIPTIQDKADRAETVTQMIKATRGVNEMLGQSMRMLDQALQNQPNAVPEENP